MVTLLQGDCLDKMKNIESESIDSIVTDPPYGLGFMGKEWDTFDKYQFGIAGEEGKNDLKVKKNFRILPRISGGKAFQEFTEKWAKECLRVLKPGGHLLSFGGSRTYHRMAYAIEDSGFEIRDQIMWVYGSGFPKSLNIGKAVDKLQGNEREFVEEKKKLHISTDSTNDGWKRPSHYNDDGTPKTTMTVTKGNSKWEGWGTALKPAHEPIVLARKPLSEKTVAENVLKHGVGGINIDGCRVKTNDITGRKLYDNPSWKNSSTKGQGSVNDDWKLGRFPANFIHDGSEEVLGLFPNSKSTGGRAGHTAAYSGGYKQEYYGDRDPGYNDNGSAARFFYCAKASKSERNMGCEGLEEKVKPLMGDFKDNPGRVTPKSSPTARSNHHPTVKPIALMEYLIKMVTPKGGTVLDPFMGSGTTGIACKNLGHNFIGIELDQDYFKIAEKRINERKNIVGDLWGEL